MTDVQLGSIQDRSTFIGYPYWKRRRRAIRIPRLERAPIATAKASKPCALPLLYARVADVVEAKTLRDDRFDYGETRYRAWGHIEGVAYCLVFTFRDGAMRPISLRRAHAKEMRRHVKKT